MTKDIRLRPVVEDDYAFMRQLYAYSREEELRLVDWSEEQKSAFVDQQFAAQTQHYAAYYPTAERSIIEVDGAPVGRLFVDRWASEIRLVDIALLPEARGAGIGTTLLERLCQESRESAKPLTIHVEVYNPAMRLYERFGFRPVDTNGVYLLMKWDPAAQPSET